MPYGAKSLHNYHAITPFYRDFCPPIISLVKKPSQWEIASLRVSLFSSLLLYMEGKQNIFIVSIGSDIKKLISNAALQRTKKSTTFAVNPQYENSWEAYKRNKPFSGMP